MYRHDVMLPGRLKRLRIDRDQHLIFLSGCKFEFHLLIIPDHFYELEHTDLVFSKHFKKLIGGLDHFIIKG